MANSPSSSDYSDTEDYVSDSQSNLSLSVGYFPWENGFFYEELTRYEDPTCMAPPIHSLPPPAQGTPQTRSIRRLLRRRDQIQDDPEQFHQLSIPLAWDMDADPDHADSIPHRDLQRCHWWADKWPEENTKLTLGKLNGLVYKLETFLENQKAQEEDFLQASSSPPQMAQVMSHESENHSMSIPETFSSSSRQLEEGAATLEADRPTPSCLNFGWAFRWLWQQVFSSVRRREQPDKAQTRWHQSILRRHSVRSNTIEPQGCREPQHPPSPDT
ncbi:uncharacterized protein C12orf71 homolog [Thomomys bottae]